MDSGIFNFFKTAGSLPKGRRQPAEMAKKARRQSCSKTKTAGSEKQ
jgi:hypothetical protein